MSDRRNRRISHLEEMDRLVEKSRDNQGRRAEVVEGLEWLRATFDTPAIMAVCDAAEDTLKWRDSL